MAQSATPQAGDPCPQIGTFAANYKTGGNPDGNMLVCNGSTWVAFLDFNADTSVVFKGAASSIAPTDDAHVANKGYVDSVAFDVRFVSGAASPLFTNHLDDLLDVNVSGPSDSQCLIYDSGSSTWQNGACDAGSTTAIESVSGATTPAFANSLDDLTDVDVASPSLDDVLLWDGSNWIAQSGITSDRNLKNDIAPISASEVNKIHSLSARTYTMKSDPTRTRFGFIAQDVAALYPHLVLENSKGTLSLDYIGLIAPMVEAIKELRAENEGLKARMQALEENQP